MKKMLVVEDDDASQQVLRRIFGKEFEIAFCVSAEEFYAKYSSLRCDIIIVDVSIRGDKHGLDLIKEIKLLPLHAQTPIICLTAHAQQKTRMTAIEAGTDLFLAKPVSNQILRDAVSFLIQKHTI